MPRFSILIGVLLMLLPHPGHGQTNEVPEKRKKRYVLGLVPSYASHIHGVAIGPIGSVHLCDRETPQVSNGINVEILGTGLFLLLGENRAGYKERYASMMEKNHLLDSLLHHDGRRYVVTHNGVILSSMGGMLPQVNGISFGGLSTAYLRMNGIAINGIWSKIDDHRGLSIGLINSSLKSRGLQIGVMNRTHELSGLQIGLWNRNSRRSLPLFNWGTGSRSQVTRKETVRRDVAR
jgi:hypothetical protein